MREKENDASLYLPEKKKRSKSWVSEWAFTRLILFTHSLFLSVCATGSGFCCTFFPLSPSWCRENHSATQLIGPVALFVDVSLSFILTCLMFEVLSGKFASLPRDTRCNLPLSLAQVCSEETCALPGPKVRERKKKVKNRQTSWEKKDKRMANVAMS